MRSVKRRKANSVATTKYSDTRFVSRKGYRVHRPRQSARPRDSRRAARTPSARVAVASVVRRMKTVLNGCVAESVTKMFATVLPPLWGTEATSVRTHFARGLQSVRRKQS